jgi:hypothetical protein
MFGYHKKLLRQARREMADAREDDRKKEMQEWLARQRVGEDPGKLPTARIEFNRVEQGAHITAAHKVGHNPLLCSVGIVLLCYFAFLSIPWRRELCSAFRLCPTLRSTTRTQLTTTDPTPPAPPARRFRRCTSTLRGWRLARTLARAKT